MNTTDYAQISSSNIRFLLTKNNMSIRQLAEKIGIAATTLNDSLKKKVKKEYPLIHLLK